MRWAAGEFIGHFPPPQWLGDDLEKTRLVLEAAHRVWYEAMMGQRCKSVVVPPIFIFSGDLSRLCR